MKGRAMIAAGTRLVVVGAWLSATLCAGPTGPPVTAIGLAPRGPLI